MKKITSLLVCMVFSTGMFLTTAQTGVDLAKWTFAQWDGSGIPDGVANNEPLTADEGLQASTALLGSENMFSDRDPEGTIRVWGAPSKASYVRIADANVDTYVKIASLNTTGYSAVKLSSRHSSSSSSRYYYLQLEYNIGGEWIPAGDEVFVSSSTDTYTSMLLLYDEFELPAVCEGVENLQLRWKVSRWNDGVTSAGQFRLASVSITAVEDGHTGLQDLNGKIRVNASEGKIQINGASGTNATVYNIAGKKVAESDSMADYQIFSLINGLYIVNVGGKAYKVLLK